MTRHRFSLALLCITFMFIAGCTSKSSPTKANFIQGLNKYFETHPECLFSNMRFPYETSDRKETAQMDSLVKSQLLKMTVEPALHVSRYTVAPAGTRYAPRFCYGHRVADAIDSSTPLTVVNGFRQTQVTYRYTIQEVPVWAKSADVMKAFPEMAHAISGESTATATLAQIPTGWQVPD